MTPLIVTDAETEDPGSPDDNDGATFPPSEAPDES